MIKLNSCSAGKSSQGKKKRQTLEPSLFYYVTLCIVADTTHFCRKAEGPCKILVHTYQTAWHHISEDNLFIDIQCHEKLKSQRTLFTGKDDKA